MNHWGAVSVSLIAGMLAGTAVAAPQFTLSASSLQNDHNGILTYRITGFAPGEEAIVERFADFNGNGVVDAGEKLMRVFSVKDGVRSIIDGVVNRNVPGDDDGAVNSAIRIDLDFAGTDDFFNRQVGKCVMRVTGASGQATQPFEITQPTRPQRIAGVVKNAANNLPIPFAEVLLAQTTGSGDLKPVGSVRADATGAYNLFVQPGAYSIGALAADYVSEIVSLDFVASGQVVARDLILTPATTRVTGKLTDAGSSVGISGSIIFCQTTVSPRRIAFGMTDGNGDFDIGITSGNWRVRPGAESLGERGYLIDTAGATVFVSSSPVTANVIATKATGLIYGRISDPANVAVPNAAVYAFPQFGSNLEGAGQSFANGDYFIGIAGGGNWRVETFGADLLGFDEVIKTVTAGAEKATRLDIVLPRFTAHLRGRVVDSNGNPVRTIQFQGVKDGTTLSSSVLTDNDGNFDLPVSGGDWTFNLGDEATGRYLMNYKVHLTIVDGVDQTITYTAPKATVQIVGFLNDSNGSAVSNVRVYATATIGGIVYESSTVSALGFSFPALSGVWTISLNCDDLNAQNFECPEDTYVVINNQNEGVFIYLDELPPPPTHLIGKVVDSSGVGVADIQLWAYNISSGDTREGVSGADGSFDIPVYEDDWQLQFSGGELPYEVVIPTLRFSVINGEDIENIQFQILDSDASITGSIKNPSGVALQGVRITATVLIGDVTYSAESYSDTSGNFQIPVLKRDGWMILPTCQDLDLRGYLCLSEQSANTLSGSAVVNFTAQQAPATTFTIPSLFTSGGVFLIDFMIEGAPGIYDVYHSFAIPFQWNYWTTVTIPPGQSSGKLGAVAVANRFFRARLRQ